MTTETSLREAPPTSRLTPGQHECLRLVAQLQSSKQIARKLGISHYTVDQRVARACRTLGASTRADAALMVAEYEMREGVITVSETLALDVAATPQPAFPQMKLDRTEAVEPQVLRTASTAEEQRYSNFPFPTHRQRSNVMSYQRRLGWAAAIAAAAIVVVGMLLTSLAALNSLA